MLSIGHASIEYHEAHLASESYYAEAGNSPSEWLGTGAQALGLRGPVQSADFRQIVSGFSLSGEKLVQNAGSKHRRCGWDLTFSPPKSVDVLWGISPTEFRAKIEECHLAAVQTALGLLERDAAWTRVGKGGSLWIPCRLVVAAFRHGTSRALDPKLHTHAVVANLGVCEDGKTRALHTPPIYRWKMAAGALYRLALANELVERLGLAIKPAKHGFELRAIPESICRNFSKRSIQIRAEMKNRGRTSARAAAVAALATRPDKEHLPMETLHESWRAVAERLGFSVNLQALTAAPKPSTVSPDHLKEQIAESIERLTSSQSHFTRREVIRDVANKLCGLAIAAEALLGAIDTYLRRSHDIIHLQEVKTERRYTTRQVMERETELLRGCDELHGRQAFGVPETFVAKTLRDFPGIASRRQQSDALEHLLSPGALKTLSGMPGTGKTFVLNAARAGWMRQGYRVIGATLGGRAARELQEQSGIKSSTISKLLFDLSATPLDALKHHAKQLARAALKRPTYRRKPVALDQNTVVVVDEAGMLGTVELRRIVKHVLAAGAKLVLVGDPQQLPAISAGAPFRAILGRYPTVRLDNIERQSNPRDIEAIHAISRGDAQAALDSYRERGLVHVAKDRRAAQSRLVQDWCDHGGACDPASHAILVATNLDRHALNADCQQERLKARRINSEPSLSIRRKETFEGHRVAAVVREDLHIGDRVMFLEPSRLLQVDNGDRGTIAGYDHDSRTLAVRIDGKTSPGRLVTVPIDKYQALTLAYAATVHRYQGATVPNAYVLLGGSMQSQEMTYVQLTRAKHATRLYVDKLDAGNNLERLVAQIGHSHAKEMAHDLLPSAASLARDLHLTIEPQLAMQTHRSLELSHDR